MKKKDIKLCAFCGEGMMHDNNILFYRVKIERLGINLRGVQKTHGLETFFGGGRAGAALAGVMGTDPEIAKVVTSDEALICDECAIEKKIHCVAMLHEMIPEDETEEGV